MITAQLGDMTIIALSYENIARLKQGQPIYAKPGTHAVQAPIVILVAPSQGDLYAEMEKVLGVKIQEKDSG